MDLHEIKKKEVNKAGTELFLYFVMLQVFILSMPFVTSQPNITGLIAYGIIWIAAIVSLVVLAATKIKMIKMLKNAS